MNVLNSSHLSINKITIKMKDWSLNIYIFNSTEIREQSISAFFFSLLIGGGGTTSYPCEFSCP